uniref:Uncharacterized protein n=1 Tax=Cyprinus carpio TaxID=7962 RepID=A0A8C2GJ10_CYPCA
CNGPLEQKKKKTYILCRKIIYTKNLLHYRLDLEFFLPGFYHLRIAYYASKGYRGYSYDDIPDFDD